MDANKQKQIMSLILRFERDEHLSGQDAEALIINVFTGCGFPVQREARTGADREIDVVFTSSIRGQPQRIGAEVRHTKEAVGLHTVRQAAAYSHSGIDRMLLISRVGFTKEALHEATTLGLGRIDLLTPSDLRRWIEKNAFPEDKPRRTGELIIRTAWREYAALLAENPDELSTVEWRDLERILREVFEGLGFETKLTRPAKDGGFDLELATIEDGTRVVYLVEVKHWTEPSRPGSGVLKNFLKVVVEQSAKSGLLLSSSGFTTNVFSGITEVERRRVRLGSGEKIIGLCQSYHKLGTEIWVQENALPQLLFEKTL